jgi:hypothetical protein
MAWGADVTGWLVTGWRGEDCPYAAGATAQKEVSNEIIEIEIA